MKKLIVAALTLGMCIGGLAGCSKSDAVKVGTRGAAEQNILQELMILALEDNDIACEKVEEISQTTTLFKAMEEGDVDLCANYSGGLYTSVLGYETSYDEDEMYEAVKKDFAEKYDITVLNPTNIENTYGLVMFKNIADELNIKTMQDMQKHAGELRYADDSSFWDMSKDRIEEFYGTWEWKESTVVDYSLRYSVLDNDEADVTVGYTTDGELLDDKYMLIPGDEGLYEPYWLIPHIRTDVLKAHPEAEKVLNDLFGKLTQEDMIYFNAQALEDKADYKEIAQKWYDENMK